MAKRISTGSAQPLTQVSIRVKPELEEQFRWKVEERGTTYRQAIEDAMALWNKANKSYPARQSSGPR
jgi:hypothetical protein